ncbi:Helix-turn-helix domain-containing protein [Thermanaeromonas toyohensis ToBE]|uniref:Helix-turn-helix domain-containing protein n=1 Tax=Thermanaeromonas toyohensis ToBE TaxID=698762 RepID=A0A1W1VR89_9FIRM|nr:helix-turn-helix domain-containing protein [Thermanaeromonas toyohensis]SMB95846.1 Helix-turn-helix domain-containing protein [Thermanaeromonas toyohensis ToBE]
MLVSDTPIILQDGRRKNWFWESNSIFDCNLSCYALVVRLYLARCAGENRVAFPSISNIAAHCGISRATVKRALAELEEKGLLLKEIRQNESGEYTSNVYILLDPKVPASEGSEIPTQGSRFSQNLPCRYMTGVGSTGTYYPPGVVGSDRTDLGSDRATEEDSLKNNNVVVVNKAPIAETPKIPLTGTSCKVEAIPETLNSVGTNPDPHDLQENLMPGSQTNAISSLGASVQDETLVNHQPNWTNGGIYLGEKSSRISFNDNTHEIIQDHISAGPAREIQEAFIKATGQPLTGRALEELMNYSLEYVLTKIAMVEVGKEKINAPGWLLEACREDYQHLPVKARKRRTNPKSPPALKLPDASKDDKYRDLYRLV